MQLITRNEANYLRNEGYEEFVKHSFSKNKKYYIVEEEDNIYKWDKGTKRKELVRLSAMNKLKEYRESRIIYTSESK